MLRLDASRLASEAEAAVQGAGALSVCSRYKYRNNFSSTSAF